MAAAERITFADFQERFKTEEQCRSIYSGSGYASPVLIAACVATIHGGGISPRNHDFCCLLAFPFQGAAQRFVRIVIEP